MSSTNNCRNCEHCVYAIKNYFSIGNRVIFSHVSACSRDELPPKETKFETKENCLYFKKDSIPSTYSETEQHLLHLYRQIDEIADIVLEILSILKPDE